MKKKHLVVLSGAGMSADSGLETFRDKDGLWAKHRIEDVCTPEALRNNPQLVLEFYNARRRQLLNVSPNEGHILLAQLEEFFDIDIITQNVDDLHERAGSKKVLHLHGELLKCTSIEDPSYIRDIRGDIKIGDICPKGGQIRPYIVFFGEPVPAIERAIEIIETANIVLVVGTSLAVYPAASLVNYAPKAAQFYVIDTSEIGLNKRDLIYIKERAAVGVQKFKNLIIQK